MAELEYRESSPQGDAAEFVRCVWSLRGHASGETADPIVSDGCVELVFNLADPFEQVTDGMAAARQPPAMIVGPTSLPTLVRPTGRIEVVGVRLQPWAGASVLRVSMKELRDRCMPFGEVVRNTARDLSDQLHAIDADDDRFAHAASCIAGAAARPVDRVSRRAIEHLPVTSAGTPSIRQLAARLGRSVRTIERIFAEDVGLSPKTLQRIERVQLALGLARNESLRWSAIAARAGYHDQSHFVRDFRALVGCTPSKFRADPAPLTSSFLRP